MKKLVIAALTVGTVVFSASGAQAHPANGTTQHNPYGILCGFSSSTDPQVEGSQTGEVDGGPLVIEDETTEEIEWGSMTCTIQVNAPTHAGGNACSVVGPSTPSVVANAGTCTYASASGDLVYLCTEVTIDGHGTLYWADSNDVLVDGYWSTDPNVPCGLATSVETDPDPEPSPEEKMIDDAICPVLVGVFPPDGDVANVWNCPPYDA